MSFLLSPTTLHFSDYKIFSMLFYLFLLLPLLTILRITLPTSFSSISHRPPAFFSPTSPLTPPPPPPAKTIYLKLQHKPICMCSCIEAYPGQIHHSFTIKVIFTKEIVIPDSHSKFGLCYARLLQLERKDLIKYRVQSLGLVCSLFLPFSDTVMENKLHSFCHVTH